MLSAGSMFKCDNGLLRAHRAMVGCGGTTGAVKSAPNLRLHGVGLYYLTPGRVPERPKGTDCKSVGLCLRRFESCRAHLSADGRLNRAHVPRCIRPASR